MYPKVLRGAKARIKPSECSNTEGRDDDALFVIVISEFTSHIRVAMYFGRSARFYFSILMKIICAHLKTACWVPRDRQWV